MKLGMVLKDLKDLLVLRVPEEKMDYLEGLVNKEFWDHLVNQDPQVFLDQEGQKDYL
jgi:hypothetical protein